MITSFLILSVTFILVAAMLCATWIFDRDAERVHEWRMEYLGLPYPGDD